MYVFNTHCEVTTTTAKTTSFSWTPNFFCISFRFRYPLETVFTNFELCLFHPHPFQQWPTALHNIFHSRSVSLFSFYHFLLFLSLISVSLIRICCCCCWGFIHPLRLSIICLENRCTYALLCSGSHFFMFRFIRFFVIDADVHYLYWHEAFVRIECVAVFTMIYWLLLLFQLPTYCAFLLLHLFRSFHIRRGSSTWLCAAKITSEWKH